MFDVDGLVIRIDERKPRVQLIDSTYVLVQSEDPNMTQLGGHLDAAQADNSMYRGNRNEFLQIPRIVMFRYTNRVKSDRLRPFNQFARRQVRVGTATCCMSVKINCEVGPGSVPASRWIHMIAHSG